MESTTFKGIITPMITPFINRTTLDIKGLEAMLSHIIDGGVNGIFLLGTTGEGASMPMRLKKQLISHTVDFVAGRTPVLVHIADCCIETSLEIADYAHKCHADYLVCALPFYLGLTQSEIVKYYSTIADNVRLPLFIYNIPAQTKLMISIDSIKQLCRHPNIIGIKDSSGNGTYFSTLVAEVKPVNPNFSILVGPDEMLASTITVGGDGGVNSGSNLFPKLYVELFKACAANNRERIALLQPLVMKVSTLIYSIDKSSVSFLKGLKAALFSMGLITDAMCEPLVRVSDTDMATIAANTLALKHEITETLSK
ncbi:MAG: dihydrodipicolinate synthase family protein [Muribaculaceae bacterium]